MVFNTEAFLDRLEQNGTTINRREGYKKSSFSIDRVSSAIFKIAAPAPPSKLIRGIVARSRLGRRAGISGRLTDAKNVGGFIKRRIRSTGELLK